MKRALIFSGGWSGHEPELLADRYCSELPRHSVQIETFESLDCLDDEEKLSAYDVVIPNWTMGSLSPDQAKNLVAAVKNGCGLAGVHGGMGDAFRGCTAYEWMVGGHFAGHPHVGEYTVRVKEKDHPITKGLSQEFAYQSEQYYLLTDPGNFVLAETTYVYEGESCVMPVAWTKKWGQGRVFYSSLGHKPAEFDEFPEAWTLTTRGILWAAHLL